LFISIFKPFLYIGMILAIFRQSRYMPNSKLSWINVNQY